MDKNTDLLARVITASKAKTRHLNVNQVKASYDTAIAVTESCVDWEGLLNEKWCELFVIMLGARIFDRAIPESELDELISRVKYLSGLCDQVKREYEEN